MSPADLLELFDDAAARVRAAVTAIPAEDRTDRTARPGQYAADLVADEAVLSVLHRAPVAVLSEESGTTGRTDSQVTVVVDPIDGSTNFARGIPYWATSLCALDRSGLSASLVVNHATGEATRAVRGEGARRDGRAISPSEVEELGRALVAYNGMPAGRFEWHTYRSLGSGALALCDVAAGVLDAFADAGAHHAPWDYLGSLLACREVGAAISEIGGEELVTTDADARRQLVVAGTEPLRAQVVEAVRS